MLLLFLAMISCSDVIGSCRSCLSAVKVASRPTGSLREVPLDQMICHCHSRLFRCKNVSLKDGNSSAVLFSPIIINRMVLMRSDVGNDSPWTMISDFPSQIWKRQKLPKGNLTCRDLCSCCCSHVQCGLWRLLCTLLACVRGKGPPAGKACVRTTCFLSSAYAVTDVTWSR